MGQLRILLTCFCLFGVGLAGVLKSKTERKWEYISVGQTKSYKSSSQWTGLVNGMFYTNENAILELSCQVSLPCRAGAYIETYNKGQYRIGGHCTQSTTSESVKFLSYYIMLMEMSPGMSYGYASYDCNLRSYIPPASQCQCGTNNVNRIVNGVDAVEGEIPWQVALGSGTAGSFNSFCGGTLLSKDYVVTAAHCIKDYETNVKIFMGSRDMKSTAAKVFGIARIRQHDEYIAQPPTNDIAMIRLSSSVNYSSTIFPACLPRNYYAESFVGKSLLVSGWGTMREGTDQVPTIMKKTTVQGITNAKCLEAYPAVDNTMLCAYTLNTDSCQGDSGGPLTYRNNSITVLAGIVSYGEGCARPDRPGVYTRVTSFLPWIDYMTGDVLCSK